MVKLNANDVMPQIALILERLSGEAKEKLMSDHHLLDECIQKYRKNFPWNELAFSLNVSKQEIYRWYFDNYERHLHGGIERTDMEIIKREVSIAVKNCTKITREMQMIIKAKLSKNYHRNAFTIAFNNAKSTLSKLFGEQQIRTVSNPNNRPHNEYVSSNSCFSRHERAVPTFEPIVLRTDAPIASIPLIDNMGAATVPQFVPPLEVPKLPILETISHSDDPMADDELFNFEWSL